MAEEKRRNTRTDLEGKVILRIINPSAGRDMEPFEVHITDLSKTGVGFRTDQQLMIGEMFKGEIIIWTKQRIDVIIKIVRSAVDEEDYSYGSIFIGLTEDDSNRIGIYQMFNK